MKLFLDDIRNPYDVFRLTVNPLYENNKDWVIVRDYYQFIDAINKSTYFQLVPFSSHFTLMPSSHTIIRS